MASKTPEPKAKSKLIVPQDISPISAELIKNNRYRSFAIFPFKTWRSIPSLSTALLNISLSTTTLVTSALSLAASVTIILPIGLIKTIINPIVGFISWAAARNNPATARRRCVVITGASSGIGAALALEYASVPNTHLVLIARDVPRLKLVAEQAETQAENVTTSIHSVDFLDPVQSVRSVRSLLTKLDSEFDGIDVAAAAAGVTGHREGVLLPPGSSSVEGYIPPLHSHHDHAHQGTDASISSPPSTSSPLATLGSRVLQVNITGNQAFLLHAYDLMKARRSSGGASHYSPSIIVLASLASFFTPANFIFYGASKTYLYTLARALSVAGAEHGINVIPVTPGFINTAMTANMAAAGCSVPLGLMGDVKKLARRVRKHEESGEKGGPVMYPLWQDLSLYGWRAAAPVLELFGWWGGAALGMAGWTWS